MRNKKTTIGRNLSREDDNNKGHYHSPTPSGQIHHNGGRTNMGQQIAPRSPTMQLCLTLQIKSFNPPFFSDKTEPAAAYREH